MLASRTRAARRWPAEPSGRRSRGSVSLWRTAALASLGSGSPAEGSSSIGRAPVSKTGGWGFESLLPCSISVPWTSRSRCPARADRCLEVPHGHEPRTEARCCRRRARSDADGEPVATPRAPPARRPAAAKPRAAHRPASSCARSRLSCARSPGRPARDHQLLDHRAGGAHRADHLHLRGRLRLQPTADHAELLQTRPTRDLPPRRARSRHPDASQAPIEHDRRSHDAIADVETEPRRSSCRAAVDESPTPRSRRASTTTVEADATMAVEAAERRRRRGRGLGRGTEADAELDAEVLDEDELLDEAAAPRREPYDRPGRWFVVHTQSGYEKKVKQNLEARISSMNMEERIHEVVIPMEDVVEFKNGKKVVVQKKVFPGYLLVRCNLDDDSWYVVRNTPGRHRLRRPGRQALAAAPQRRRDLPAGQARGRGGRAAKRASPASSTSWARPSGSRKGRSPTSRARSSRSTRTSSRSRCWSTSSAARPRSSSSSARSPSSRRLGSCGSAAVAAQLVARSPGSRRRPGRPSRRSTVRSAPPRLSADARSETRQREDEAWPRRRLRPS